MVGSHGLRRLVRLVLVPSALFLSTALAGAQDSVASWLDRLGLDRLRMQALRERLDESSLGEEERGRVTDQLLALYKKLLAEETDEVFVEELNELSGLILEQISLDRGDPIRLDLYNSEWRSLITRALDEIVLGRSPEAQRQELLASILDLSIRVDEVLKRADSRSRKANKDLREAQGSQIEARTRSFDELEDTLRKVRSLSGWIHAYLGWFTNDTRQSNIAQRMFASLLSSDGLPFVVPNDNEISIQRRSEDWYAELIIGMAIAQAPEASYATVEAWLDLLSAPGASESARLQVPFYRLALLLSGDAPNRYSDSMRMLDQLGPDAPIDCLRITCLHALDNASSNPDAAALAQELLTRLLAREGVRELFRMARGISLEDFPADDALGCLMRGCRLVLESRELFDDDALEAGRASALAAIREIDAALALQSRGATFELEGRLLLLRASMHEALERPLAASLDFESAAILARGTEAGDLLWNAISAIQPQRPGVSDDPALSQRRALLVDQLISKHPAHPRSQAARVIQMESNREYTLDDAEELLQPNSDPATAALARRKAASILYRQWVRATARDREVLGRRFLEVVRQLELIRPDGSIDERDLGLLIGSLRLSLQASTPDPALAADVISAVDQAIDSGALFLEERALEYESLRIESMLKQPLPDFVAVLGRFQAMPQDPEDPFVRRSALLLVLAARNQLGSWTVDSRSPSDAAVIELIRACVGLLVGPDPLVGSLEQSDRWQLVRTLALAEERHHEATGDQAALLRSFALYEALFEARPLEKSAIIGLARTARASGNDSRALEACRLLMKSASEGTPEFFESKFNYLDVLSRIDPDRARTLLVQHEVLYPDYGLSPWGDRLRGLHESLMGSDGGAP